MNSHEAQDYLRSACPGEVCARIDGQPQAPGTAHPLPVVDPASGEQVLVLLESDAAQVDRAVASARQAFDDGRWSRVGLLARQAVLQRTAELLREEASRIAALDSLTTGLVYEKSTRGQVMAGAGWFDYFAGLLASIGDDVYRQIPHASTLVTREPVGVAGLFTPWNIPIMGASLKLAAALAMGNSAVIKPSEQSPLGTVRLVELLHEAGLPAGVVQLVNGRGQVTGAALAEHRDVGLISFTGGEGAGRAIAGAASRRFAKVTMELGGKSANIVFADADYERALDGAIMSVYANNGEACLAGARILVEESIAGRFTDDLVERVRAIRVGAPFGEETEMGPQAMEAHMHRVLSFVDAANDSGSRIYTGGERLADMPGFYVAPTVVGVRDNSISICQDEIFGPFATVQTFRNEQEAVAIANDTRYGLAGYVWSENLQCALRVADRLRTGYVLVNTPMVRERNAPFGGIAQSGIDREGGRWSLDFYSEAKTTVIPFRDFDIPTLGKA